ncbi:gene transfer agent family protein [Devosia submarina]|uniref:gene transfer agent family protein n=1 Tax=Devosia submarina TaxID=1173082 RepID=UPI000D346919|nr:gene transfer agent family protein [Devosia submarina]
MSRDAKIDLDWADGHYDFRLAWGHLIELQEQCDAGPFVILQRLSTGQWKLNDISHTIRLALIGGGVEPAKAIKLTRDYVESRPPLENVMLARGILGVALQGAPDEKPGEAEGEATGSGSMTSPTESSE